MLIDELARRSGRFRRLWAGTTARFSLETLVLADDLDRMVLTYTPADAERAIGATSGPPSPGPVHAPPTRRDDSAEPHIVRGVD